MCSSIPACLVLLGSSPVLLCLSLARLWQGAASPSHSHSHSLPSLCKPPPQSQRGWSRFPCCGCMEEHGRRERSSPHLTLGLPAQQEIPAGTVSASGELRAPQVSRAQGDRLSTLEFSALPQHCRLPTLPRNARSAEGRILTPPQLHKTPLPQSSRVHRDTGALGYLL